MPGLPQQARLLLAIILVVVPDNGWAKASVAEVMQQASSQKPPSNDVRPTLEIENQDAHVWKVQIPPKKSTVMHRHNHPRVVVALAGGDVRIVTLSGQARVVRWQTGKAYWLPADPPGEYHSYANDGARPIEFTFIEFEKS